MQHKCITALSLPIIFRFQVVACIRMAGVHGGAVSVWGGAACFESADRPNKRTMDAIFMR
jgi:hypothetical protein